MATFLIADDHSIVRGGLVIIIKSLFKDAAIFQACSFDEIEKKVDTESIDFLILDINFPEGNSLGIISKLKSKQPKLKILMFSNYDEDIYALRYIKAGADGYLSKLSSSEEMETALLKMVQEGRYTSARVNNKILDSLVYNKPGNPIEELSDREMEIATLLVNGIGNLEISNLLKLKATTVSTYKTRIFEKLGVHNLSALIQIFKLHNN
jgi:DNA-binding NarL/FixJ family response regulator